MYHGVDEHMIKKCTLLLLHPKVYESSYIHPKVYESSYIHPKVYELRYMN